MAWVRLDDNFDMHPKILALGTDQRRWTWLRVLIYTTRFRSSTVPKNVGKMVGGATPKFIEDCIKIGLIDRSPDGTLDVHDWRQYQGSDSKMQIRERVAKHRQQRYTAVTDSVTKTLVRAGASPSRPLTTPPTPSKPRETEARETEADQERLRAWREHAASTPGVRSVEGLAQHGFKSGEWPPELTASADAVKRVDPSTVCADCGETLGAGHLEDCPRLAKTSN